jgi:hypothetical protein
MANHACLRFRKNLSDIRNTGGSSGDGLYNVDPESDELISESTAILLTAAQQVFSTSEVSYFDRKAMHNDYNN